MQVRYEVKDHIATMTLNRPEALNAFTDEMEAELIAAFDRSDGDDDVRVVILTGVGRAFCAGMDLAPNEEGTTPFEAWRRSPTAPAGTQYEVPGEPLPVRRDGGGRLVLRIFESLKPVIAAINGHAVGVGITMTLPCDLRILASQAKIAFPFTRRGFVPESCSSWFLPRVVPIQRALEWMLTGRTITAQEAFDAGLALELVDQDDVFDTAWRFAREIAVNVAPASASLARQMLWQMLGADHPMKAHQLETAAINSRGVSADAHEGVLAFLEKRTPAFTDTVSSVTRLSAELPRPSYQPPNGPLGG
jgi:enoyl-CoA hydratase/carnithine racemase